MQNTLNDSNALALQCICNCDTHIYTFFQKSITQSTDLFPGGSGNTLFSTNTTRASATYIPKRRSKSI